MTNYQEVIYSIIKVMYGSKNYLILITSFFLSFIPLKAQKHSNTKIKSHQYISSELIAKTTIFPIDESTHFTLPLKSLYINSQFGWRWHPLKNVFNFHQGVDLHATADTVMSIGNGKITNLGFNKDLGNFIIIDHGKFNSIYGHLSKIFHVKNSTLKTGTPIGISGKTGKCTGEHLHFAINSDGVYIHPLKLLYFLIVNQKPQNLNYATNF